MIKFLDFLISWAIMVFGCARFFAAQTVPVHCVFDLGMALFTTYKDVNRNQFHDFRH